MKLTSLVCTLINKKYILKKKCIIYRSNTIFDCTTKMAYLLTRRGRGGGGMKETRKSNGYNSKVSTAPNVWLMPQEQWRYVT